MYHKKKEMGMGGMNMPNPMKKPMPGGGMVSPMRMEMGHGGDMERAVKIYLMKKGGKTAFPDLTGDGKVTFADILKGRLKKGKKKSMQGGGRTMTESEYLEILRRLDPKGEYRSDRLDLAYAKPVGQLDAILKMEGNFDIDRSKSPDRLGKHNTNMRMSPYDLLMELERGGEFANRRSYEQALNQVYSKYPHGKDARTDAENLELSIEIDKVRRKYGMGYGGKVKLKSQGYGGKVEYGIGGAVMGGINALMQGKGLAGAAGAAAKGFVTPGSGIAQGANLVGNLAQKSNNPMLQNIGKVAGMASNFLPGGNPAGALGNLAGMFQARGGMMVPPKMRLLRR